MTATVRYQVATYRGEVQVNCEPDEENEVIIAKARRALIRRSGELPYGKQAWKVMSRS
jgi:hypothetical protein